MTSSVYANNKVNNILVLGKDFIQGIKVQQFMQKARIPLILQKAKQDFV